MLPGFRFVISFDGLHDALSEDDFTDLLGSHDPVEMIASRSLDRAVRAGSSDDISTIYLDVSRHVAQQQTGLRVSRSAIRFPCLGKQHPVSDQAHNRLLGLLSQARKIAHDPSDY